MNKDPYSKDGHQIFVEPSNWVCCSHACFCFQWLFLWLSFSTILPKTTIKITRLKLFMEELLNYFQWNPNGKSCNSIIMKKKKYYLTFFFCFYKSTFKFFVIWSRGKERLLKRKKKKKATYSKKLHTVTFLCERLKKAIKHQKK